ncbi:MAG: hypothetical protein JWQ19_3991 [Subtercola sp.]|nr:hypothetical protein [Subtercola sp.]
MRGLEPILPPLSLAGLVSSSQTRMRAARSSRRPPGAQLAQTDEMTAKTPPLDRQNVAGVSRRTAENSTECGLMVLAAFAPYPAMPSGRCRI